VVVEITDTRNVPGHRDAGAGAWHVFGVGCLECEAYALSWLSLEEVKQLHRSGMVDDPWFRAYMRVWTTRAERPVEAGDWPIGDGDWTPRDERTRKRVGLLEEAWGGPPVAAPDAGGVADDRD
jgi:hypothetical protein